MATNDEILDKAEWRVGYTGMWKWLNREDIAKLLELARADERAKVAEEIRDSLYEALPSGEISAFDLIKVIQQEIKKIDEKYLGKQKPEGEKLCSRK